MAWLNEDSGLSQCNTENSTGVTEPGQPTFEAVDFGTSMRMNEQSRELELAESSISSGEAGDNGAAGLDASWFAVARSGVDCVLCTVRGFQLRCVRSVTTGGGAATGSKAGEAQCADRSAVCKQCGLQRGWSELDIRKRGRADDGLQDGELIRVAGVIALWEQMKSAGASIGGFDAKQMAAAYADADVGADADGDRHSNARTPERNSLETAKSRAATSHNGRITPADEDEYRADGFFDGDFGADELETVQSSTISSSVPASSVYKRKASGNMTTGTPAKMGRRGDIDEAGGAWTAPSLFNEAMVAQVRRTDAGMRHEAMGQHEVDAFTKWREKYQILDGRSEAKNSGNCNSRGRADVASAGSVVARKPGRGRRLYTHQRSSKVLRKKVAAGGELVGWPTSSGCWKCGLPAWRCDGSEHVPGRFFKRRQPEAACQDKDMLRHIAGSVLAHFEAGAACVVAQVKESWGKEKIELESQQLFKKRKLSRWFEVCDDEAIWGGSKPG
ncbi:hypothetical protein ACQKWADRAFT_325925 [Trichoderma austrokoningii]